jgi:hypothetical protein
MDRQLSKVAYVLALLVERARAAVANAWQAPTADPTDKYRPEAHYMRGSGPKGRAKHAHVSRGSVGRYAQFDAKMMLASAHRGSRYLTRLRLTAATINRAIIPSRIFVAGAPHPLQTDDACAAVIEATAEWQ